MKDFRKYILGLCGKKEGYVVEFKSAKGGFPGSFWETYSSFANTAGGIIVLGIKEKDKKFYLDGLTEDVIYKYKKVFWDCAHNVQKVNLCLLKEDDVIEEQDGNAHYLIFKIPRASYDIKPIYLNGDPFHGNTFRRNHEGDYHCSDDEVRRMMADSIAKNYGLDRRVIDGATVEKDLDADTIRQFRIAFQAHRPTHPWCGLSDIDFLKKLKAIADDPETKVTGVTGAGILMFGTYDSIRKAAPNYFVDFREKLSRDPGVRYTDRYYPDGTWEPNLYQFFNRVFNNMDQALPHPFKLDDKNNRIDGTPADESLREAICNTLIHCDWSMMSGVVIERYLDRFVFINPGTMLISVEDFFKGGNSICRNPYLQDMFISMGLGEHLGSGADVIKKGWKDNGWPEPELNEYFGTNTDRVELTLHLKAITSPQSDESGKSKVKSEVKSKVKTSERIKELMQSDKYITLPEIANILGLSISGIEKSVRKMREDKEIIRHGADNGGYWEVLK